MSVCLSSVLPSCVGENGGICLAFGRQITSSSTQMPMRVSEKEEAAMAIKGAEDMRRATVLKPTRLLWDYDSDDVETDGKRTVTQVAAKGNAKCGDADGRAVFFDSQKSVPLITMRKSTSNKCCSLPSVRLFLCFAFLLFICCLFVCCSARSSSAVTLNDDPIGIMKKMSSEFNLLSGPSLDVLELLQLISERSKIFLKMVGPAGSILAACLETFILHDEPIMKALGHLHSFMEQKFVDQNRFIERTTSRIRAAYGMLNYDTHVTLPLKRLSHAFREAIDPRWIGRESVKREFVYSCREFNLRPRDVLEYINEMVNLNCRRTTYKQTLPQISDFKSSFLRFLQQFTEHYYYDALYLTYLQMLEQYVLLPEEEANSTLITVKKLTEQAIPTNGSVIELMALNDQLRELFVYLPVADTCLLRTTYESYSSRRHPLILLSEIIATDIVQLSMIGGMCANITNSGDQQKTEHDIQELAKLTSDIAGNVSQWVTEELQNAWPYEIARVVKDSLKEDITDPYAYNYTAGQIDKIVSARGPFGYISLVLVTESFDTMVNFYYRCPQKFCYVVKGHKAINFALIRHEEGSEVRADNAVQWFNSNYALMYDIIMENAKISELGSLMRKIEMEIGGVTAPFSFHTFFFLRVSTMTAKACVVPVGLSTSQFANYSGFNMVEVYSHYRFPTTHDERFKLLLFL